MDDNFNIEDLNQELSEDFAENILEQYVGVVTEFVTTLAQSFRLAENKEDLVANISPEDRITLINSINKIDTLAIEFELWDLHEEVLFILEVLSEKK